MSARKIFFLTVLFFLFGFGQTASAHQPRIVFGTGGDITIENPEVSQAFYDELKGNPRNYFINSAKDFDFYINLLTPLSSNPKGRYSANVYLLGSEPEKLVASLDGLNFEWQEYYEEFGRDYYLKGPEFKSYFPAGKYRIEVYSQDNQGKYVLAAGEKEFFDAKSLLNVYWQLPLLKMEFFKTSVLQFFFTPFGIAAFGLLGALLIIIAVISYAVAAIGGAIEHKKAKTILLTSAVMQVKDVIIKLLQKPAYDVNVAFISTAAKPEEDASYVTRDWDAMREMGFNLEEVDIEGKTEKQLIDIFETKDIVFVEGGNTFYLLKVMRNCNFEKVMRKFLKKGTVYIGASAGSIVAGKTIETAGWKNADKNIVHLKNLKGLNFVPFNVFVHYQPEHAELIKQKIKSAGKRKRTLKILTDDQAILLQGRNRILLGKGEEIIV